MGLTQTVFFAGLLRSFIKLKCLGPLLERAVFPKLTRPQINFTVNLRWQHAEQHDLPCQGPASFGEPRL